MNKESKILVTGGKGFLGKIVCRKLKEKGYENFIVSDKDKYDLSKETDVNRLFEENKGIDIVIHLAAVVGGIKFNKENPGRIHYENTMINTLIQEYSRRNGVSKFIGLGSVCAYPKFVDVPFKEENLWDGFPEESNASYGLTKKMMFAQSKAYRDQFGFNSIHLLMINLYGPGDNFDLDSSHVIPALIKKIHTAKKNGEKKVVVWGSGNVSREFIYVEDAAEGIIRAAELYDKSEPINVGTGKEITIKELVKKVAEIMDFEGEIIWDKSRPDGQMRRRLDVTKAEREFGFKAQTSFEDGLKNTIDWYIKNKEIID